MKKMYMVGLSLSLSVLGVFGCSTVPDPSPEAFISFPTSRVIGKSRASLERNLKPIKTESGGWVRYTRTFKVRFEDGQAVEMMERVPRELGCKEAAIWLGFKRARAPILEKKRCLWPADDVRHSLGKNVSGVMTFSNHVMRVKRE